MNVPSDPAAAARAYYRSLDTKNYDLLAALLDPSFTQQRPDRSFDSPEAFVEFMRNDRPNTETCHDIDRLLTEQSSVPADAHVAVEGTLRDSDGEAIFSFVDVMAFGPDVRLHEVRTYTR